MYTKENPLKVLSLFSGIGAFEKALKRLGVPYELVGFSEIDKYAIESYCAIHSETKDKLLGNIIDIDIEKLPTDISLVTHGSPCQDFSCAGHNKGGDIGAETRSSLMWNTVEIVGHCKPKFVLWENVKNVVSKKHIHNFEKYLTAMEQLGYKNYYEVINAKLFNTPQNRERLFVVSIREDINIDFKFPSGAESGIRLKDILQDNVEEKYYVNTERAELLVEQLLSRDDLGEMEVIEPKRLGGLFDDETRHQAGSVWDINGLAPTLDTMQGGYRQPCILEKNRIRKITPTECWLLMTFEIEDINKCIEIGISNTQLYKQSGNSIPVNILVEIFRNLVGGMFLPGEETKC